jgi:hypothetical protein
LSDGVDDAVQVLGDGDPAAKNHFQTGTEAPEGLIEDDSSLWGSEECGCHRVHAKLITCHFAPLRVRFDTRIGKWGITIEVT